MKFSGRRTIIFAASFAAQLSFGVPYFGAASAHAQTPSSLVPPAAEAPDLRPLVSSYSAASLRDLPSSDNLFAIIETLQPSIVSDRFSAGGLYTGQPARIGGFLSSWSQTVYRIDGVPITDPTGSGAPLLFPELALWDTVNVSTGLFGLDTNATGLAVDLTPVAPSDRWVRHVEGMTSHFGSEAQATGAPAIARLEGWDRLAITAGGPIVRQRLGVVFAASATRGSQFDRGERFAANASLGSLFSHLVFTPNLRNTIRVVGWLQRDESPLSQRTVLGQPPATTTDRSGHAQAVWEHGGGGSLPWRVAASYSGRRRTPDFDATTGVVERLQDGPVTEFTTLAGGTVQTWSLAARFAPTPELANRLHRLDIGVDATGGRSDSRSFFRGTIGELVHGSPARVWVFRTANVPSLRHSVTAGAYVNDRILLGNRLTAQAGVRVESADGTAEGATTDVSWRSILPHASARWNMTKAWQLSAFAGYSRSTYRLALDYLALGDPGAPTADVYRWTVPAGLPLSLSARGELVARVGPGTGGDPTFNAIASDLKAPTADEVVIGFDMHPTATLAVRLTGVTRSERDLLGVTNFGAPAATSYSSFTADDPGADVLGTDDDQVLTVYNRLPASYAKDQYMLTNPARDTATFKGLELSWQLTMSRLVLMGGATAGIAETSVANRGFGPLENDQGILGELFANPNAATLARGRTFTDRAYTVKLGSVFILPAAIRIGLLMRYQDGQPFARAVVFPGLNQGAEAVRAFSNGESRFLYVGTLDGRVQKAFTVLGRPVDAFLDAYNLLNRLKSVEEDIGAPPNVRITTAVQPPRAIHAGLRVAF